MNLRQTIITIAISPFFVTCALIGKGTYALTDLEEGVTYTLWNSVHISGARPSDEKPDEEEYYEKDILEIEDYNLIRSLPVEVKTIIASYTQFRTFLFEGDTEQMLAEALGGFETLEQARKALLVNLKNEVPDSAPYQLSFYRRGNILYFDHSGSFGYGLS